MRDKITELKKLAAQ
ncbi:MAG: hypothetical protein IKI88_01050 [Anaerotignum sp.]|nr:hypothetical protein [Anaerotignum sp.]